MSRAFALVRWLWWAAVATLPILAWKIERFRDDIRDCSPPADCAHLGSTALFYSGAWFIWMVVLLWPVCAWFLFVEPWQRRESM